jgi:hypothetical protein
MKPREPLMRTLLRTGHKKHGRRLALSMVEVAICTVIIGIALVAVVNTTGTAKVMQQKTGDRQRGVPLAEDLMTEILQQLYEDPNFGPGSFGLGADEVGDGSRKLWEDVDDYDGWSASPPQQKDGTVIQDFDDWQRSVEVDWVDPAALSDAVGYDTGVKLITVTVSRNGVEVATLQAVRTRAADESQGNQ